MPLRPFPFQLGIGTDIIHVNRVRKILEKAQGRKDYLDRFLRRLLTPLERINFYKTQERLADNQLEVNSKHLAGRWAAKEAVIKAVSWRRLSFHDILIQRSRNNGGVIAVILDKGTSGRTPPKLDTTSMQQVQNVSGQLQRTSAHQTKIQPSIHIEEGLEAVRERKDEEAVLADNQKLDDALHDVNQRSDSMIHQGDLSLCEGQIAKISISHDGEYAIAMCIVAEEPAEGDVGGEASARAPF